MRFWLRRGVDGFRVDVLWHLIKDDQFRDNPPNPKYTRGRPIYESLIPLYTTDRPEMQGLLAEMRGVVDEFGDRLLIGEIYLPLDRLVSYYGRDLRGVHLPFNFALLPASWRAETIVRLIGEYEKALPKGGWPNWVLGNHDWPRIAGRVGPEQARTAAMLLLTLRGTPTIYYGDEIGMPQAEIPFERVRDRFERVAPGQGLGRDGSRTPMQWDDSKYAGFSEAEPWLPLADAPGDLNVADQRADPTSVYQLYRQLIVLRRSRNALLTGSYFPLLSQDDLLLFGRRCEDESLLVALNLGGRPELADFGNQPLEGKLLLSSHLDREGEEVRGTIDLRPNEGVVIEVDL